MMAEENRNTYYTKKKLLVTLKRIEKLSSQKGYFIRNFKQTVALGLLLSLSIPAQGLATNEFKGPSILVGLEVGYWELAFYISVFYTIGCLIGHYVWKWQDEMYLKELHEDKVRLMRELGL